MFTNTYWAVITLYEVGKTDKNLSSNIELNPNIRVRLFHHLVKRTQKCLLKHKMDIFLLLKIIFKCCIFNLISLFTITARQFQVRTANTRFIEGLGETSELAIMIDGKNFYKRFRKKKHSRH